VLAGDGRLPTIPLYHHSKPHCPVGMTAPVGGIKQIIFAKGLYNAMLYNDEAV
jgi:hypothetical protein